MREKILINDNWRFHKGDIKKPIPKSKFPLYVQSKTENQKWGPACLYYNDTPDDSSFTREFNTDVWHEISLPHDFIIDQEPSKDENCALGFVKYFNGWYRKHLTFDESDRNRHISLYFEGIAVHSEIYVNGCLLKRNFCGYTPFKVDITDFIRIGEDNVIAVYVNTENHEGWWYEGGGIYRNVYLCKTDMLFVDLYGVYVKPVFKNNGVWEIQYETTLKNSEEKDFNIALKTMVYDKKGNCVSVAEKSHAINGKSGLEIKYFSEIENPVLWDIDNPYLYKVVTDVYKEGVLCDTFVTSTGFRTFLCDPEKGFFLNGRHVKIKGICAHQDCAMLGKAVPDNLHRHKINLIKEMGANGYRTSHYPHSESTMDALDQSGFIVMDETRWFSSSEENCKELATLIKRDRNHPSVFFWSIGNEEPYHTMEQGVRISATLKSIVKELDDTRIITTAVSHNPKDSHVYEKLDAIGVNYNLDDFDILHNNYPMLPVISTECCATSTTRSWYYDKSDEFAFIPSYDHDTDNMFLSREKTWKFIMQREYIMGCFQWIAFEHRGETVWPRLCSQSGAIDLYLQKKDAFYQNQSLWSDKPMIHMLPHWNYNGVNEGEKINVWAYTNCSEAELFINGVSEGRKTAEKFTHIEWIVPYKPGEIKVIGYNEGKKVASHGFRTSENPAELVLKLENTIDKANGRDIAIIKCYCVDKNGIFVPDACPTVRFHTNKYGFIKGTGSDITDHSLPSLPIRKMRDGYITVAVQVGKEKGVLRLYADSEYLKPTFLDIDLN